MTKAVLVNFHNYCWTMDHKYFNVMFDYFMKNFKEVWYDEVDKLYILDSHWDAVYDDPKVVILKAPEQLRYYDVFKWALPEVKEEAALFVDNDTVIYREGVITNTFLPLEEDYDVAAIYDTIGTFQTDKMNGKNKLCFYWCAMKTKTLMKYRHVDWSSNMPETETFGELTKVLLGDDMKMLEIEEDKTDIGKNLGYYHIRAGAVPAYLLTTKHFGNLGTYWDYLNTQPESEILRHCNWLDKMGGDSSEIRKDLLEKDNSTTD